ncbi:MAG: adenylate/guanylate cyclase domain-containing protein, partial [Candidatus Pacearchaeota archaeon]
MNKTETSLFLGYESFEKLFLYESLKIFLDYTFLGWNFIVFLSGIVLCIIYKKLYYLYLSAFEIFLLIFFLGHQFLLNYDFNPFSLFLSEKIKFLFLLFSGYTYFLFTYRFFHEEKNSFNKIVLLIGGTLFGVFLSSLFLSYEISYKVWMTSFCIFIVSSFVPIFYSRKDFAPKFYLFFLVSLIVIAQQGILFLTDIGFFVLKNKTLLISNLLNFAHVILILATISLEARRNIKKRIQTEQELHELEKQKLATEKKILELEKISLEEKSKLNFAKNEFIKQTVQSLRTPLVNIANVSELLLEDSDVIRNQYINQEVRTILENSKVLLDTLQDLSDFSLLETNSLILNNTQIDLNSIFDIAIISLNHFLIGKNIQIIKQFPPNLPLVNGDEDRLLQTVRNLLLHVIENCSSTSININSSIVPGYIKVKIRYLGSLIKIPHSTAASILDWLQTESNEDFQRILNLVVTSRLIKLGGGRVYSKQDNDAFLILFLPISQNQNKSTLSKPIKQKSWSEFYIYPNSITNTFQFLSEEPETILVIEHETIHLDSIQAILNAYNYKSILVNTTQAGLEEIHKEKPSVVLIDLFMQEGYKFCQLVREIYDKNELPILLITSGSNSEEIKELFEFANDTIAKPFTKEKLISKIRSVINLSKINQAYKRFVPPEFIGLLNKKDISELKLGDHVKKRMTVLFSDLRDYTRLSEGMTPEENFNFLNSYLKRIGPIIRNHSGFIDKYIGDAIMAIFPKEPEDAVRCAIEIQKSIHEFNIERLHKGDKPISAGIGIHTGDVILGTLGEEKRMEGTVISDAVNLSSRLENLTKLYKTSILISMDTFLELEDQENYNFRILDRVKVKGKEQFVTVVEIMDGYEQEKLSRFLECKIYFEEG